MFESGRNDGNIRQRGNFFADIKSAKSFFAGRKNLSSLSQIERLNIESPIADLEPSFFQALGEVFDIAADIIQGEALVEGEKKLKNIQKLFYPD